MEYLVPTAPQADIDCVYKYLAPMGREGPATTAGAPVDLALAES